MPCPLYSPMRKMKWCNGHGSWVMGHVGHGSRKMTHFHLWWELLLLWQPSDCTVCLCIICYWVNKYDADNNDDDEEEEDDDGKLERKHPESANLSRPNFVKFGADILNHSQAIASGRFSVLTLNFDLDFWKINTDVWRRCWTYMPNFMKVGLLFTFREITSVAMLTN